MKLNVIDDNCIDGNLDTECRTGGSEELPYIDFKFNKNILIKKIVIYNRTDDNKRDNYPLKIHLFDNYDHIILTGSKETKDSSIIIENKPPDPPLGCKNFDQLNI